MPNWCMNSVHITGDADIIAEIEIAANDGKLLEYLNPIGEWDYAKAIDAWGTKWEVSGADCNVDVMSEEYNQHCISLTFDTAWGPPIEALRIASNRLSIQAEASFYEPGMSFVGYYNSEEDDEEEVYEYDFEDENWDENIPDFLIEEWALDSDYEYYKEMMEEEADEEE